MAQHFSNALRRFSAEYLDEVRARVSLVEFIGKRVRLIRHGRDWFGSCPFHSDRSPSFSVTEDKGFFHCFGCGAHGDVIGFAMAFENISFITAVGCLAADAGVVPGASRSEWKPVVPRLSVEQLAEDDLKDIERARAIWQSGQPWRGTDTQLYLRSRGIEIEVGPTIRHAPSLRHHDTGLVFPVMLAVIQAPDGQIAGVHRTFLQPGGTGKAPVHNPKQMKGRCWGGAVRLDEAGPQLRVGEGIETMLSVKQTVPDLPCWAALSLGNLAGAGVGSGRPHPRRPGMRLPSVEPDLNRPGIILPDIVKELTICADADNSDAQSAEMLLQRAARRFKALGLIVKVARPPVGFDFNDLLLRGAA